VLDRIRKTGELRVGMTGDYPPLSILDKRDQTIGLEPDLARALASTLGVELEVVRKPFGELIAAVENGDVDMAMSGITMTPERNMRVAFAGPYFISGKAVLTRSELLARADGPSALDESSIKLVVLAGTTSEDYVKTTAPNAKLITTATYEEAVAMVVGGSADAMVADYPICVVSLLRNPGAGLLTVLSPFTFEPIGMALPADDTLFVNLVQNYLTSLEGTGLLGQLRDKWFKDPSWIRDLP
jgi:polar amino acid transport system substrate-binding protein